jgi:curli production assembly/transport component CsgE
LFQKETKPKPIARIALAAMLALSMSPASATERDEGLATASKPAAGILREQYGGLVTDQTVTVFGHSFYRSFVSRWRDEPLNDRYAISVYERRTARFGSQVWIEYAQRRIFQAFLLPSNAAIQAASEKAVAIVSENIMNTDVQRLLFRDADIGPDEL